MKKYLLGCTMLLAGVLAISPVSVFASAVDTQVEEESNGIPEINMMSTGESEPGAGDVPTGGSEPGIGDMSTGESEPGAGDVPTGGSEPGIGDMPTGGSEPGAGDVPTGGSEPEGGDVPQNESEPESGDVPQNESEPESSDVPQNESEPESSDVPQGGSEPGAGDMPDDDTSISAPDAGTRPMLSAPKRQGFVSEKGKTFFYENNKLVTNAERYVDGHWYYFGKDGAMATGWTNHHGKQYYYNNQGQMAHGVEKIDNHWYGFDEWTGVMLTGEHLFTDTVNNDWYYFYEDDSQGHKKGQMATGWTRHHGNQYYYDENGIMAHHIKTIDDVTYGFNEWTGVLLTGEHYFTDGSDDHWYYFGEVPGKKGHMATGWTKHHGNQYYYNDKGQMIHGTYEIDGNMYLFDEWTGVMRTGWVAYQNEWYCMKDDGVMYRGEQYLDDHWYYFDEITGITANKGFTYHHDQWYYYNDYGYMQYGDLQVDDAWYYFDPWTGVMQKGWVDKNGRKYYYDLNDGHRLHGKQTIDGKDYYFDTNTGVLQGTDRAYQNPAGYYQIQDSVSLSGGGYNIGIGHEGLKVAWVMRALGMGQGIGMPANGGAYYSWTLASKVSSFQQRNGLNATGIVDLATWKALGYTESDWYNLGAYVSPMKITKNSTRSDCIEAMISTAYGYLGTSYIVGAAGAPGTGIDCSGLVMQALYSAGIDLSPINPVRHSQPGYEYESRNMYLSPQFQTVSYANRERGDLIFYSNGSGVIIHVAIYLGNNQVIESWPNQVVVWPIVNAQRGIVAGVRRPFVKQ